MNVFDWLSNMEMPMEEKFDVAEVRFKGGRKEFFRNTEKFQLTTGDAVVVEVPNGHHMGYVSLQGELVRLQMQKKKVANDHEIKKIYRLAHQRDIEKQLEVEKRESQENSRLCFASIKEGIKHSLQLQKDQRVELQ